MSQRWYHEFLIIPLAIGVLASCTSRPLAPDSLYDLPTLAEKNLAVLEAEGNLARWYNTLMAVEGQGLLPDQAREASWRRLREAMGAVKAEGPHEGLQTAVQGANLAFLESGTPIPSYRELLLAHADPAHREAFRRILEGRHPPELLAGNPREALEASVTIQVDLGTRLVQGVGFPERVIGSGFFIDREGYILTNHHVIASQVDPDYKGQSKLWVRTSRNPQDRIPATVIAWDRDFDLALVKVPLEARRIIDVMAPQHPETGAEVFALGSPGGLENTMTRGIISAQDRHLLPLAAVTQVDAAVNPGNSGGALVDSRGQFAGVVFAGVERFEGVNFVLPGALIQKILPFFAPGGGARLPGLGITWQEDRGQVRVSWVQPGSPAALAGLVRGDVLTSVQGRLVTDRATLFDALLSLGPGQVVSLGRRRVTEVKEVSLALDARDPETLRKLAAAGFHRSLATGLFGMVLEGGTTRLEGPEYRIGDLVPQSPAEDAGFTPGDLVTILGFGTVEQADLSVAWVQVLARKRSAAFVEGVVQLAVALPPINWL